MAGHILLDTPLVFLIPTLYSDTRKKDFSLNGTSYKSHFSHMMPQSVSHKCGQKAGNFCCTFTGELRRMQRVNSIRRLLVVCLLFSFLSQAVIPSVHSVGPVLRERSGRGREKKKKDFSPFVSSKLCVCCCPYSLELVRRKEQLKRGGVRGKKSSHFSISGRLSPPCYRVPFWRPANLVPDLLGKNRGSQQGALFFISRTWSLGLL